MRILRILSGALLAAAVAVTATATPAAAHVSLIESSPTDGAELDTTPEAVELTFSEVLDVPSTKVAVTDADGDTVDQAEPDIHDKTITQPMRLPKPGEYTVAYRIVSQDGHPVEGSISFTVATVPESDRSSTDEPADDDTDAADTDDAAGPGIGWGPVTAIAAGLALVVIVTLLLVRRRSRES